MKVIDFVVRSDAKREDLLKEERVLSSAIEDVSNPNAVVLAFRKVEHDRLVGRMEEARRIATRRSGARGMKARKVLIGLEEEVGRSEQR